MYHQWFNSAEYGKRERALIEAINALGSKAIPHGEQPNYEKKIEALKKAYNEYLTFCELGHKKEIDNTITKPDEFNTMH